MFEFFNKKRKAPSKPKGNDNDAEKLDTPDAEGAIDNIDAALAEADRIKERDNNENERRRLLEQAARKGCGCF